MSETIKLKERDTAIDFVKFIATLLVLNSHMDSCYGKYSFLSSGGSIGDALFFFVSGFVLFMGKKIGFLNWYKRRINRIYPTILAMGIIASIIFGKTLNFLDVLTAQNYWFLQCILVGYILVYPIIYFGYRLSISISITFLLVLISFFVLDFDRQMFYGEDNYFRWIFYFLIMLIGGAVFKQKERILYRHWHILALLMCLILWYGIIFFSKYNEYISIVSLLPLAGICYFTYSIAKSALIKMIFETKILGNIVFIIGSLCLESYMIQKYIITDAFNNIFPLNILVIILLVMASAYILRILSCIISQIFDTKEFNWKALLLCK